jgi:hypothetical protein
VHLKRCSCVHARAFLIACVYRTCLFNFYVHDAAARFTRIATSARVRESTTISNSNVPICCGWKLQRTLWRGVFPVIVDSTLCDMPIQRHTNVSQSFACCGQGGTRGRVATESTSRGVKGNVENSRSFLFHRIQHRVCIWRMDKQRIPHVSQQYTSVDEKHAYESRRCTNVPRCHDHRQERVPNPAWLCPHNTRTCNACANCRCNHKPPYDCRAHSDSFA